MTTTITIHGVVIPVNAVESLSRAVPVIIFGIGNNIPPADIIAALEPTAISIIESIAAVMFPPFGGTIVEILMILVSNSKPFGKWTDEELQSYWDKAQGVA